MQNWRDRTSPSTQEEIDALVRVALGVAQEQLASTGTMRQSVVAYSVSGELETETDTVHGPSGSLTGRLSRDPHQFRAAAVVAAGRELDREVVRVRVEHRDGVALAITAGYEVVGLDGGVAFSNISSMTVAREIWTADVAVV